MKYQVRTSLPLLNTQFNGDDDKKKKKKKTKTKKSSYTEKDLTPAQIKKINSVNLSPSAKQKAINSFAILN
jgi:hypothetical protein